MRHVPGACRPGKPAPPVRASGFATGDQSEVAQHLGQVARTVQDAHDEGWSRARVVDHDEGKAADNGEAIWLVGQVGSATTDHRVIAEMASKGRDGLKAPRRPRTVRPNPADRFSQVGLRGGRQASSTGYALVLRADLALSAR